MPYLADVYQLTPEETFNPDTDWKEVIGDSQTGGGEAFSLESGEATIVVQLDWAKSASFLRYVLGFSYADKTTPYRLRRENPEYHPRFPWLTATTCTFSAIGPKPNDAQTGTFVDGAYSDSQYIAQYNQVLATVRYTDLRWTFLEDTAATDYLTEARRNTYFEPSPSVEMISATGLNNIIWANNPAFVSGATGSQIPAPFGTLMSKCVLNFRWMWVPNEYISGSDSLQFTPKWINACVGRVNSATFLGYPKGTLLLQAPQYQRFRFPVNTQAGIYGYFGYNVTLPMVFFDPDRGGPGGTLTVRGAADDGTVTLTVAAANVSLYTGSVVDLKWGTLVPQSRTGMTVTVTGANTIAITGGAGDDLPTVGTTVTVLDQAFRGHQLCPYRNDLKWYGVKRQTSGDSLYPQADFHNIFRHVDTFIG